MNPEKLRNIVEALIMISSNPMTAEKLHALIEDEEVTLKKVKQTLSELQHDYEERGIELKEVASGFRFQARNDYLEWSHKLMQEKPARYSRALLETLAIIAYRQPATRAEVEAIRGVAVSTSIMRSLVEREWVRVVGHRDVPGKPSIYATTKAFLDYFNLKRLDELPPLSEVKDLSAIIAKGEEVSELIESESLEQDDQAQQSGADNAEVGLETPVSVNEFISPNPDQLESGLNQDFESVCEEVPGRQREKPVTEMTKKAVASEHSVNKVDNPNEVLEDE